MKKVRDSRASIHCFLADTFPAAPAKSTEAQIIDQRRKSSAVNAPSSLAKTTSIDESHTVETESEKATSKAASGVKKTEKPAAVEEENDEEDDEEDDDEEDDESDEEESDEEEEERAKPTNATKISATNKEEGKALKGTKPQDGAAKDGSQAGVSVAD